MSQQVKALDAGARYAKMPAHGGLGHASVTESEDIADEHMVNVKYVVKALGSAEQQIAAAAPELVFHLIVYLGYKLVAGGLDDGEVEFHLAVQQL